MEGKKPWEIAAEGQSEQPEKMPWEIAAEQESLKKKESTQSKEDLTSTSVSGGLKSDSLTPEIPTWKDSAPGVSKPSVKLPVPPTPTVSSKPPRLTEEGAPYVPPSPDAFKSVAFNKEKARINALENPEKVRFLSKSERYEQVKLLDTRQAVLGKLASEKANQLKAIEEELKSIDQKALPEQFNEAAERFNKKLLELDAYGKRMDSTQKELVSLSEGQDAITNSWDALNSGMNTLTAGLLRAPQFVFNTMINAQNGLAKLTGIPIEADYQREGYLSDLAKDFDKNAEEYKRVIEKKHAANNGSIVEYFEKGDISGGVGLMFEQIMESAPITAGFALSSLAGPGAAATIVGGGAVFGAEKYEELQKENPKMNENAKFANAWATGMVEGIFEETGTVALLKHGRKIMAKGGKEALEKEAKNIFQKTYAKAAKKLLPVTSATLEGLSEAETAFTQNIIAIVSGEDEKRKVMDGVPDAFLVGAGQGSLMGLAMGKKSAPVDGSIGEMVSKYQKSLDGINKDLQNPNLPDATRDVLNTVAQDLKNKIDEANRQDDEMTENLSLADYNKVVGYRNEVEEMKASLSEISSPELKDAVLLKIEEVENKINEVINPKEVVSLVPETEAKEIIETQRKQRDLEIQELEIIRPDLTDADMLIMDIPEMVDKTIDRMDANIPTDPIQVEESIAALDKKFDELEAYKNDPKRTHSIAQINEVIDLLGEAKKELQIYQTKNNEYESRAGEKTETIKGKPEVKIGETTQSTKGKEELKGGASNIQEPVVAEEEKVDVKGVGDVAGDGQIAGQEVGQVIGQEAKERKGARQIKAAFDKLNEAKTPEEKLNAINTLERNEAAGGELTKDEKRQIQKVKDNLSADGYEAPQILNKSFHEGMKVLVTNSTPDETLAEGEEIITKIFEPQINKDGKMVQAAQIEVTVGTKKGGLTKSEWLKQKSDSSKSKSSVQVPDSNEAQKPVVAEKVEEIPDSGEAKIEAEKGQEVVNTGGKPFNGIEITTDKFSLFHVTNKNEVEVIDKKRAMSAINGILKDYYNWDKFPDNQNSTITIIKKPIVSFDKNGEAVIKEKGKIVFDAEKGQEGNLSEISKPAPVGESSGKNKENNIEGENKKEIPAEKPLSEQKGENKVEKEGLKDAESRKKEMRSENDKLIKRKRELANDRDNVVTGEGKYKNFGKKERDARLEEIRGEVNDIDTKQVLLQKELRVIEAKETGSVELFDHSNTNHGSTNTIIYDIKNDKLIERENVARGKTKDISIENAAKQNFAKTQRGRNEREINELYTDEVKAKYEAEIIDKINQFKESPKPITDENKGNKEAQGRKEGELLKEPEQQEGGNEIPEPPVFKRAQDLANWSRDNIRNFSLSDEEWPIFVAQNSNDPLEIIDAYVKASEKNKSSEAADGAALLKKALEIQITPYEFSRHFRGDLKDEMKSGPIAMIKRFHVRSSMGASGGRIFNDLKEELEELAKEGLPFKDESDFIDFLVLYYQNTEKVKNNFQAYKESREMKALADAYADKGFGERLNDRRVLEYLTENAYEKLGVREKKLINQLEAKTYEEAEQWFYDRIKAGEFTLDADAPTGVIERVREDKAREEARAEALAEQELRRQLETPRNASDVAKIFGRVFKFAPWIATAVARMFDAKAKRFSQILGITREEYYSQYWLGKDEKDGLNQGEYADVINGFYSPLEKIITESKFDKLPAKQWADKFKGEEAKWTGLTDWLNKQTGSVSKADIQKYLKDNRIEIKEVVKGETFEDKGFSFGKTASGEYYFKHEGADIATAYGLKSKTPIDAFNSWVEDNGGIDEVSDFYNIPKEDFSISEIRQHGERGNESKFQQYQLEGEKENYKEVLVTLPNLATNKRMPKGFSVASKNEYKDASEWTPDFVVLDENGISVSGGKTKEIALDTFFKTYAPVAENNVIFRSGHFDETNILVHLRMNTRTDADGNKVLFLEEIQSDWGQKGKKEGFTGGEFNTEDSKRIKQLNDKFDIEGLSVAEMTELTNLKRKEKGISLIPSAPFVTDTNAWTKLGLKVALKEAVKQGADKIAWTTGEQQNERYDLSKQVDEIRAKKNEDGTYKINAAKDGSNVFTENSVEANRLSDIVGKELAQKIIEDKSNESKFAQYKGQDLKVGGKGMKGFYGSPTEGSLGIVGNVAKSLFKQEPGTVEISTGEKKYEFNVEDNEDGTYSVSIEGDAVYGNSEGEGFKTRQEARNFAINEIASLKGDQSLKSTQHSIDITPELRAEVEKGLPLFQTDKEIKGKWAKEFAYLKRLISMYENADSTTAIHEILGHDYLDRIIEAAKLGDKQSQADFDTIVDEYIKAEKPKESRRKIAEQLRSFNVETNKNVTGKEVHEWFARTAEQWFANGDHLKPEKVNTKLGRLFEKFRQQVVALYEAMGKSLIEPSDEMKKVFRRLFGEENFEILDNNENVIKQAKEDSERFVPAAEVGDLANELLSGIKKKSLSQGERSELEILSDIAKKLYDTKKSDKYNISRDLKQFVFPNNKEVWPIIDQYESKLQAIDKPNEGERYNATIDRMLADPNIDAATKELLRADEIRKRDRYSLLENIKDAIGFVDLLGPETVADMLLEQDGAKDGQAMDDAMFITLSQIVAKRLNAQKVKESSAERKRELAIKVLNLSDAYAQKGSGASKALNALRAWNLLDKDSMALKIRKIIENTNKDSLKEARKRAKALQKEIEKLKEEFNYIFDQTLDREEQIGTLQEEIAGLNEKIAELEKAKARTGKERKSTGPQIKKGKKISINFDIKDAFAEFDSQVGPALYQGPEDAQSGPIKAAYFLLQDEKTPSFTTFIKKWNSASGKKYTAEQLRNLYEDTVSLMTENGFEGGFSSREEISEIIEDERIIADAAETVLRRDVLVKHEAMLKELAKKQKESLINDVTSQINSKGLWDQYIDSAIGELVSKVSSNLSNGNSSEKAILQEFTKLLQTAIKEKIDEVIPSQKKQVVPKTAKEIAEQIGDLAKNEEKFAELFDAMVEKLQEKYKGDINAINALQAFSNIQNPFSEKLLSKAAKLQFETTGWGMGDIAFGRGSAIMGRQMAQQVLNDSGIIGTPYESVLRPLIENAFAKNVKEFEDKQISSLASFIVNDAKTATGAVSPKNKTFVDELIGTLKKKAREEYKAKNKVAPSDPIELIKFALKNYGEAERIGSGIWQQAQTEVYAKIMADNSLNLAQKADAIRFLKQFSNSVIETIVPAKVMEKEITNILKSSQGFTDRNGNIKWDNIITSAGDVVSEARDFIENELRNKLGSNYNQALLDNSINKILAKYDQMITEKKKEIVLRQMGKLSSEVSVDKAPDKKIGGMIGKLIAMDKSGMLDEKAYLDLVSEYLGINNLTDQEWSELDYLLERIFNAPEGFERISAINDATLYLESKMPGYSFKVFRAIRYANMLSGLSTWIKNSTGILDVLWTSLGRTIREGDVNYLKLMAKGFKQGDFLDILRRGSANQGDKIDMPTDSMGLMNVHTLERWARMPGIVPKIYTPLIYVSRILDATDAAAQRGVSEMTDYYLSKKQLEYKNPSLTTKAIRDMSMDNMFVAKLSYEDALRTAVSEIQALGDPISEAQVLAESKKNVLKQSKNTIRAKRRAYEIMRKSRSETIKEFSAKDALKTAFKSDLKENSGLFTGAGRLINTIFQGLSDIIRDFVNSANVSNMSEAKKKATADAIAAIPQLEIMPIIRGLANFAEVSAEKFLPYGIAKGGYKWAKAVVQKKKNFDSINRSMTEAERIEYEYKKMQAKDMITSALIANAVVFGTILMLQAAGDDDENEIPDGFYGAEEEILVGKGKLARKVTVPRNSVVIGGRIFPMAYFGTVGFSLGAAANYLKQKKEGTISLADSMMASLISMLSASMFEGVNRLGEVFKPTYGSKEGMGERFLEYMENLFTNGLTNTIIPLSNLQRQVYQGGRMIFGENASQDAIGMYEKMLKSSGFLNMIPGLGYDRPTLDYTGDAVPLNLKNPEGVGGLIGMFTGNEIEPYKKRDNEIGLYVPYNGKTFEDGYMKSAMTDEEYYDYKKNVADAFKPVTEEAYRKKNEYSDQVPVTKDGDTLLVTKEKLKEIGIGIYGKPYDNLDAFKQRKVVMALNERMAKQDIHSAIEGYYGAIYKSGKGMNADVKEKLLDLTYSLSEGLMISYEEAEIKAMKILGPDYQYFASEE